ncbi:hypothetical protein BU23DRAFT_629708 [Bimuria novae-zelandiae CBS 107.79]|uniref:Uncharacterized protein n=1 Tax=Bimuria novae-zelandiae CBS 107.79 TaxID=1447943 RepID=A0A6A5VGG9_9PLEO|nr:hypothetical protein BU23DRAFT_629708 [Bimuria novae-zelandiae CBS 107.79]
MHPRLFRRLWSRKDREPRDAALPQHSFQNDDCESRDAVLSQPFYQHEPLPHRKIRVLILYPLTKETSAAASNRFISANAGPTKLPHAAEAVTLILNIQLYKCDDFAIPLAVILFISKWYSATDPRDRIYAVQNLAGGRELKILAIGPEYNEDVTRVYTKMAARIIEAQACMALVNSGESSIANERDIWKALVAGASRDGVRLSESYGDGFGMLIDRIASDQAYSHSEIPSSYLEHLSQIFRRGVFWSRQFAIDSEGNMCLVPDSVRRDNLIVIIASLNVPLVMRPLEGNMYEIIEECYVHGYMYEQQEDPKGAAESTTSASSLNQCLHRVEVGQILRLPTILNGNLNSVELLRPNILPLLALLVPPRHLPKLLLGAGAAVGSRDFINHHHSRLAINRGTRLRIAVIGSPLSPFLQVLGERSEGGNKLEVKARRESGGKNVYFVDKLGAVMSAESDPAVTGVAKHLNPNHMNERAQKGLLNLVFVATREDILRE